MMGCDDGIRDDDGAPARPGAQKIARAGKQCLPDVDRIRARAEPDLERLHDQAMRPPSPPASGSGTHGGAASGARSSHAAAGSECEAFDSLSSQRTKRITA